MKELTKQIKEKSFHKVYLLTGDEPYLVLQAKHMLKNAMIKEGDTMNYAAFTDGKIDLNTLQELAFTYPFFSEKRLLLLDGTGILKTGKDEFSIPTGRKSCTKRTVCKDSIFKYRAVSGVCNPDDCGRVYFGTEGRLAYWQYGCIHHCFFTLSAHLSFNCKKL